MKLPWLLPVLLVCHAADGTAAAIAAGRHWRIAIDAVECEIAQSRVAIGTAIRYLGPKGPVEAPVIRLVDGAGKPHLPRSLVWRRGSKAHADWLSAGGVSNVQSEDIGEVRLRFELRDATGDLQLEFGDIRAFSLTRKRESACDGFLKPGQIQVARKRSPARAETSKARIRVYRGAYPCMPGGSAAWRTTEAQYPPYLPQQLLLLGRGYLPNAREVALPMGRAAAQSYAYAGLDELDAIDAAGWRAIAADFPEDAASLVAQKVFAFNWGAQRLPSGNEAYSIGIYDARPCPK